MLRVALLILVALLVQQTIMVALRVDGAHPDLLWLLPITAALLDGPETGAIVGFWSGLAFDLVLPTPFGLSALVGCLLGYAVGSLTTAADPRATWLKPVAALAGSVAADMLFAVLGAILGQGEMVQVNFLALLLVVGISSVVLVLPGQPADAVGSGRGEQPPLARAGPSRQQGLVKRTLRHPIRGDRLHPRALDTPGEAVVPGGGTQVGRACGRARASMWRRSSAPPRKRRPGPTSASVLSASSCCSSSVSSSCDSGRCRSSRARATPLQSRVTRYVSSMWPHPAARSSIAPARCWSPTRAQQEILLSRGRGHADPQPSSAWWRRSSVRRRNRCEASISNHQ